MPIGYIYKKSASTLVIDFHTGGDNDKGNTMSVVNGC